MTSHSAVEEYFRRRPEPSDVLPIQSARHWVPAYAGMTTVMAEVVPDTKSALRACSTSHPTEARGSVRRCGGCRCREARTDRKHGSRTFLTLAIQRIKARAGTALLRGCCCCGRPRADATRMVWVKDFEQVLRFQMTELGAHANAHVAFPLHLNAGALM